MHRKALAVSCLVLALGWILSRAAAQDKAVHSSAMTRKLAHLPTLPTCTSALVESGDPSKGGSVMFAKAQPGCNVPWHWHTPNEQLMMVSGRAKVD